MQIQQGIKDYGGAASGLAALPLAEWNLVVSTVAGVLGIVWVGLQLYTHVTGRKLSDDLRRLLSYLMGT
jgi:hypothetical protein